MPTEYSCLPIHYARRTYGISRMLLAVTCCLFMGCLTPANTRFPTLSVAPPGVEAAGYQNHDPFPEESAGPDTFNRPRSFVAPRDEPRNTIESQSRLGVIPGGVPRSNLGPSSSAYPDAVLQ